MMPNSIIIVATGSDVCDMSPVLVVGVCLLRWFLKAEPNSNTALSLHTLKQLEQLSAVTMVMVASFLFTLGATRKSCVSTSPASLLPLKVRLLLLKLRPHQPPSVVGIGETLQ